MEETGKVVVVGLILMTLTETGESGEARSERKWKRALVAAWASGKPTMAISWWEGKTHA